MYTNYSIRLQTHNVYSEIKKFKTTFKTINFQKYINLIKSPKADCIVGYNEDDIDRAEIGCSNKHTMASTTMNQYIQTTLQKSNKAISISCPLCNQTLNWKQCTQIADFNVNEYNKWTNIIQQRIKGEHQSCPKCNINCKRGLNNNGLFKMICNSCNHNWCWECTQIWKGDGKWLCGNDNCTFIPVTNQILAQCKIIKIYNVNMPEIRACPICTTLLEMITGCKHFRCWGCKTEFCFVCLGIKNKQTGKWSCGAYNGQCNQTCRQSFR